MHAGCLSFELGMMEVSHTYDRRYDEVYNAFIMRTETEPKPAFFFQTDRRRSFKTVTTQHYYVVTVRHCETSVSWIWIVRPSDLVIFNWQVFYTLVVLFLLMHQHGQSMGLLKSTVGCIIKNVTYCAAASANGATVSWFRDPSIAECRLRRGCYSAALSSKFCWVMEQAPRSYVISVWVFVDDASLTVRWLMISLTERRLAVLFKALPLWLPLMRRWQLPSADIWGLPRSLYHVVMTDRRRSVVIIQIAVHHCYFLWPPYGIEQAIIFLPCGFFPSIFFSSPNLNGQRLDVYPTSTHGVALVRI